MTRDDVIRMAREAGFEISREGICAEAFIQVPLYEWDNSTMLFERFVSLVAQQERNAILAKIACGSWPETVPDAIDSICDAIRSRGNK